MSVWQGTFTRHLRISHQVQPPPPANHQPSDPPHSPLYSRHRQCPRGTHDPDGSIPAPSFVEIAEETDSEDDGFYQCVQQPHSPAQ